MNTGGICIGCTMPGFPDDFAPFYKTPPGTVLSSTASKTTGSFVRPLRRIMQRQHNREHRWIKQGGDAPSGWGRVSARGGIVDQTTNFFYKKLQHLNTRFEPGSKRQRELQAASHAYIGTRPTKDGLAVKGKSP